MPNTREKLIELLACAEDSLLEQAVAWDDEQKEEHIADGDGYGFYADHLIANGVTISNLETVNKEWIPVTERLPEKHGRYLALTPGYIKGFDQYDSWLIWYHPETGFYDRDSRWGDIEMDDVTHWMPLPEPPKGE